MNFLQRVLLTLAGCYVTTHALAAEEQVCPPAPFETDMAKISAALSSESMQSGEAAESERLTDGMTWSWGGGLGAEPLSGALLEYDARHYRSRYVSSVVGSQAAADIGKEFDPTRLGADITITEVSAVLTRVTVTARPTAQQARAIACMANQLFVLSKSQDPQPERHSPPEVTVMGSRPLCSLNGSDGYFESLGLLTSRPEFVVSGGTRGCEVEIRLKRAVYEPIEGAFCDAAIESRSPACGGNRGAGLRAPAAHR